MRGKPTRLLTLLLLVPLTLTVCKKRGPNYEQPVVPVPASYRAPDDIDESSSIADLPWWELFEDPVLQELIEIALAQNKDLLLAITRIEAARGSMRTSRAGLYPTLDAGAGIGVEKDSNSSDVTGDFAVLGFLNWELDLWGRIARLNEAARAQFLAAEENRRAIVVSLVGDVAQAYFELRNLDNQLTIAERTYSSREESLRIARLRFEGGLTAELVVRQAEVQMAGAMTTIPQIRRDIALRENEISILLGKNPEDIKRGLPISDHPVSPSIPVGLPSDLLTRRPDILRAEQELIAANALIGVAEAEFFPRISLTGLLGMESPALQDLLSGGTFELGLDAAVPVLNRGELEGNLEIAQAQYRETLIYYEQVIQEAFREVSDAIVNHSAVKEIRAVQEMRLEAAREYLRLARLQYLNGFRPYLDVLDAERELFDAELILSRAMGGQLTTMVDLYRVLGGGWSPSGGPPQPAAYTPASPVPPGAPTQQPPR